MIERREDWSTWVTPQRLRTAPIHRWYTFPHSFTHDLVEALMDEWNLAGTDCVLDPFVGAGTTVLTAKTNGIPAVGYDLSPLATFVTGVKIADFDLAEVRGAWERLLPKLIAAEWAAPKKSYADLVSSALPPETLAAFEGIDRAITRLKVSSESKGLFRLSLLATIPEYSRAIATGGWLSWVRRRRDERGIPMAMDRRIRWAMEDLGAARKSLSGSWRVSRGDARQLPDPAGTYSAVITSPPYPNRHDYTRVFGVELMYGFLDWQQTRTLRYQSFHSHPEARPERTGVEDYVAPRRIHNMVSRLKRAGVPEKISGMIEGYFLDMFLCARELKRVCKPSAPIALVVGNARYAGIPVIVDELTALVGEMAGLRCERIRAVRFRGNSAQQMGAFGRKPSRESVVILRNG